MAQRRTIAPGRQERVHAAEKHGRRRGEPQPGAKPHVPPSPPRSPRRRCGRVLKSRPGGRSSVRKKRGILGGRSECVTSSAEGTHFRFPSLLLVLDPLVQLFPDAGARRGARQVG